MLETMGYNPYIHLWHVGEGVGSTNPGPPCAYCGSWHGGVCPRIKSIEYYENGQVRRVVFRDGSDECATMDDFLTALDLEDGEPLPPV